MKALDIDSLFACFIVVAGLVGMFAPISNEKVVMFCLGVAAGYITRKITDNIKANAETTEGEVK